MTYRDKLRIGVHSGDIHLGVRLITAEEFKYQLYEKYIKPMSEMMFLDFITINGDVSDCPLPFNSKLAEVYLWYFDSIIKIAKEKNASVIVIKGTTSHECDHLNNVKFYKSDKNLDIHFIEEPTEIEVKGLKIYCLPDIYIKDPEEEKKIYHYPDGYFDYILGHGSITETQFVRQETENSISKNIIYNTKELLRISKGPILFGHIHQNLRYRGRIYYINSFTRFSHSEEEPKGYMVTAYETDTSKYIAERIENTLAFKFNTFFMKHIELENTEVNDIVKKIDKFIEKSSVDRLCLDIQYINTSINVAKIQILRNYYGNHKVVNKTKFKSLSAKEAEIVSEAETKEENKREYLRDKSIKFDEKLQRFINEEYNELISLEKIQLLLMSDELLTRN
jgi:hypothetical protein